MDYREGFKKNRLPEEVTRKTRIRIKRVVLSVLITLIPVFGVFFFLDMRTLLEGFYLWQLWYVIPAFIFYTLYTWVGGLRIKLLAGWKNEEVKIVSINAMGSYCRNMIPAGIGEVVYAFLVKRFLVPTFGDAFGIVIVSRVLDIVVGTVLFTIALPVLLQHSPRIVMIVWGSMTAISLILVAFMFGVNIEKVTGVLPTWKVFKEVEGFGANLGKYLRSFREGANLWPATFYTLVTVLTLIGVYGCICFAIGKNIEWSSALYLFFMLWPMSFLPIRGFFDFGTHESGWVVLLLLLGYDFTMGLSIAIASHLLLLVIGSLIAMAGCLYLVISTGMIKK